MIRNIDLNSSSAIHQHKPIGLWVATTSYWGAGDSNPIADPNPRLQLLVEAARRGAKVRLLLGGLFDDQEANRSNQATVEYLEAVANAEGLDIVGAVGNPASGGIHAKWLLARVDGVTWSAVGSLNGGEISHKVNHEDGLARPA